MYQLIQFLMLPGNLAAQYLTSVLYNLIVKMEWEGQGTEKFMLNVLVYGAVIFSLIFWIGFAWFTKAMVL